MTVFPKAMMNSRTKQLSYHLKLLLNFTKRELKLRYTGSLLGSYWNIINPIFMIVIYTVIFSQVMHNRIANSNGPYSYSLYLCSGLFAWNLFSECVQRGTTTLMDQASFIKKLSFPPLVLFGATYATAVVNFLISFLIFSIFLFSVSSVSVSYYLLFLLVSFAFGLFGIFLGIGLGCLNVFTRDVQQVVGLIFSFWFWFTPIIYIYDVLPEMAKKLLYFNPAFPFISILHNLLYFQKPLEIQLVLIAAGWLIFAGVLGLFIYSKTISLLRDYL